MTYPGRSSRRIDRVTAVTTASSVPGAAEPIEPHEKKHPWWRVMCLTGVDYFSTLGYQPGIAALAAGLLSPIATLVLVFLTLFGALPVYRRVAAESPHGQGSIAMLERLLSRWGGKAFVLALLGFAATDFIITMTLSAADGAAHVAENPLFPDAWRHHTLIITLVLLALLGAVFLRGFTEAIGIAVALVATYLTLNAVVIVIGIVKIFQNPGVIFGDWKTGLFAEHGSIWMMVAVSLLVFPKLALGMSGYETGVAVMPQVVGDPDDAEDHPVGRIRRTKRMLTAAALIMSCFLITSSWVTTLLIPAEAFEEGGPANGRALAYLAHGYLGNVFGTAYDISTILILWFAGASAMAGLLNLIPRYLPRYGMSPEWAAATRPLVVIISAAAFLITWVFDADVDAQGGAYATGVLVLMCSAGVAVALAAREAGQKKLMVGFVAITTILAYTLVSNVIERPDGVKIATCFIAAIIGVSLVSRIMRSFELRVTSVELDKKAETFLRECARRHIRLIANEHDGTEGPEEYEDKLQQMVDDNELADDGDFIFVEVLVTDPSDFEGTLKVRGEVTGRRRVLRLEAPAVPNALAATLLYIRDVAGVVPHIYFEWTEGNPVTNLLRFLFIGVGEVAPTTREILRRAEPDRTRRPHVHVG